MRELKSNAGLWPDATKGPWTIDLIWQVVDGRAECMGATITSVPLDATHMDLDQAQKEGLASPTPLSATLWRELPIATIIDNDRAKTLEWIDDGAVGMERSEWEGRGRRPRYSAAEVARIYTEAWRKGEPPTKAVAEALGISRSAAAKQVARARALGFIATTERGRAKGGEA